MPNTLALPCMLLIYDNKLGRKEITKKTERSHLIVLEMTIMMKGIMMVEWISTTWPLLLHVSKSRDPF